MIRSSSTKGPILTMKKITSNYHVFFFIGALIFSAFPFRDVFFVKFFLLPLAILLELIGVGLMLINAINNRKLNQERSKEEEKHNKNSKKLGTMLLPLFSSILSMVSCIVLLLLFTIEDIAMWRYYLIAIVIIQTVVMIVSTIILFKHLKKLN